MPKQKSIAAVFMIVAFLGFLSPAPRAQTSGPRLALVIGNAQYRNAPLATPANDAGLIAQTLTTAGFDVTGAADLDQDSMRRAFKEFLTKLQAAGPHAIGFVYLAGYGLQYSGENYFVPVDATLQRDTDIPIEAIRVSDFTHALTGLPLAARIFVLDAGRANAFPLKGSPLAGGLALIDPEDGTLEAFNAAPGTIAPAEQGPYGTYARALAEMLRYGGLPLDEAFARTRLRVNELTHGGFVPWDASKLAQPPVLLAANPDAAALPPTQSYAALRSRPVADFPSANEAYAAAIEIDTLAAYQEFLHAYPSDPLAFRVRALLAARREALTWNRTVLANTPDAYWSYMRRYPRGPHFFDARRRLTGFSVSLEPPPRFDAYDFQGLPPPPEDEYVIVDRPAIIFEGPDYAPAPPPPPFFLAPPPPEFRRLPPPEPRAAGVLPTPQALPLPFARPAVRPGSFSQPNLAPQAEPGRQPPGGGHPNTAEPHALPEPQGAGQPRPGAEPNHALPATPQGQPGRAAPEVQPGHALPQTHPEHAQPEPPHPAAPPAPHVEPPHPLQHAEPEHAAPPAPHVEPQHPTAPVAPHAEPPHPATPPVAPRVEPPHPPAAPHVEPPHAAPPPPPAPHPAAPPAAAAPAHPPAPPHPPKPGEKEEKPGEPH